MSSFPLSNTSNTSDISLPVRSAVIKVKPSILEYTYEDGPLDATGDARRIVRLVQCPQCSYPLLNPVALPCGNALCRKCLPTEVHARENISYPQHRMKGFKCPFPKCGLDHVLGDCATDYLLKAIVNDLKQEIIKYRVNKDASAVLTFVEEQDNWAAAGPSSGDKQIRSRLLPGGRLCATYTLAEMGELSYDSEVAYTPMSSTDMGAEDLDFALLEHFKGTTRKELDCRICMNIYLDPYTTTCGHTFCRKCLQSVFENSMSCPTCRRSQVLAPTIRSKNPPVNLPLARIISALCSEGLALRADVTSFEEEMKKPELSTPLFVCTLAFPQMPTFLHVFEPRYKLMIERAMQSDRRFGMILHNSERESQGDLGPVHFYQYGTLLEIRTIQRLPDGRSILETMGISTFKVLKWGTKDGYTVGDIERIDDISIADEEALEIRETTASPTQRQFSAQAVFNAPPHHLITSQETAADRVTGAISAITELNRLPTQELFEICSDFVKKMKEESAPWLHSRVYAVYGPPPNDPAIFPWWFANVLPTSETEKYRLLQTTSVRERLKISAGWVKTIERYRCGVRGDDEEEGYYVERRSRTALSRAEAQACGVVWGYTDPVIPAYQLLGRNHRESDDVSRGVLHVVPSELQLYLARSSLEMIDSQSGEEVEVGSEDEVVVESQIESVIESGEENESENETEAASEEEHMRAVAEWGRELWARWRWLLLGALLTLPLFV